MTVHKAKGLEFPVVILADLTCRMSRDDANRYVDAPRGLCAMKIGGWAPHDLHEHEAEEVARDRAEGVRLAYVAATRARDLLVVPALGDGPWEGGWLSPLNRAMYPPIASRRASTRGPGCPAFKSKDSVLERPDNETAGPSTVCPGSHAFEPAGYAVVWWDPGMLSLGAKPPFGVRREELIVKDVPKHVVAEGRGRYDRWRLARASARASGSVPSLPVETVREWASRSGSTSPDSVPRGEPHTSVDESLLPIDAVVIARLARLDGDDRPHGAGFGSLVHSVLARVPFDADRRTIAALSSVEARMLGLEDDDAAAASSVVERVLAHDLVVLARAADARGACRRETPITYGLADGTLIEGIVDLAFEHEGTWTVVDYKTDREVAALGEEQYRRQVALYASAIARATRAACDGIVLVI
jgi:ATP-dependent exoDNAse (exonuclease V) beta subunit